MVVTHNKKKFNQSANSSAGVIVGWHRYEDRHNVKFSVNKLTVSQLTKNLSPIITLKYIINYEIAQNKQYNFKILQLYVQLFYFFLKVVI